MQILKTDGHVITELDRSTNFQPEVSEILFHPHQRHNFIHHVNEPVYVNEIINAHN